ncbi:MAG TPA: SpoIIE family protein phosphatase [Streptomyces sp.]|nr:SpoIIE family protein phosphatase [Streptomyces sp.]
MNARGAASGDAGPPVDWPAGPQVVLPLNHTGCFDWNLDDGRLHLDSGAMQVFDLRPDEFDLTPAALAPRLPHHETTRLDALVSQAIKSGRSTYGAYFRLRRRDGWVRWTHVQGCIMRTDKGRPYRIVGIVRDATEELNEPKGGLNLDAEGARQTSVVEEITAALAHARTVDDVIQALGSSRGLRRLGADSVALGLVEGGLINVVAVGPASAHVRDPELSRIEDELPLNEAVRTLTPRFVVSHEEFLSRYPALRERAEALDISAAAFLPLIAQAAPIAALGLIYRDKDSFTAEERTVLTALTSSIAQSLQRAILFEQEHELAESLQQSMLPHTIPAIPGMQTAVRYRSAGSGRDIGGDWYDVIPLPGGKVAAVIGDVQGHDTQAAAVMGQVRIVLRAYATEGHSAGTVVSRASAFLQDLDTDRFATCLYAEADPAGGWLRLVRAGHPEPLLRRADGSCRTFPVMGGLPLGLSDHFGQSEYPVVSMELEAGETLLMFTDGLVERPGSDLTAGVKALIDGVRGGPQDLHELADSLCELPGASSGDDDMALLLLRRELNAAQQLSRRLHQHVAAGDPRALSGVREMVRAAAESWQAEDRADDVVLVTDELVSNALLHSGGGALVEVRMLGGAERRVRIEVTDRSSSHPQPREPTESSVSGRGLLLVERLADFWGVESRGAGKCVWSEFLFGT